MTTIPTRLPALARNAIRAGWHITTYPTGPFTHAYFNRRGVTVAFCWETVGVDRAVLEWSRVNDTPTPFTQCAALLNTTEEA